VTSKPTVFSERIVRHFDLAQYFAGIHGSELDGTRSEKAELIAHVLEKEGIPSFAAVMIGDRSLTSSSLARTASPPLACSGATGRSTSCNEPVPPRSFPTPAS